MKRALEEGYTVQKFKEEKREKKKLEDYKREQEYIDKQEKLINRFRA